MSQIKLLHSGGNGVILAAPDSNPASDRTLKLPSDADGTIATTATAGKILQVKQAVKTDTASSNSATFADIAGLSVSITPTSSSNKILVNCNIQTSGQKDSFCHFLVFRDSTSLGLGTEATGNMSNVSFASASQNSNSAQYGIRPATFNFLDSPSSTSALTYKVQFASAYYSYYSWINRPHSTTNEDFNAFCSSQITVMEVAA